MQEDLYHPDTNFWLNRSFLYGDGFFESFLWTEGNCEHLSIHVQRMQQSAEMLEMSWNSMWTEPFFRQLLQERGKEFDSRQLRVKLLFFRESKGNYLPESDNMNFHLFITPYATDHKTRLRTGIYTLAKKPVTPWSSVKSTSSLFFVMAAKFMRSHSWDEMILLNEYGNVCEGVTSNIYLERDGILYTPPLSEGCINGVHRQSMLLGPESQRIVEKVIKVEELPLGKIYFSNAIRGLIPAYLSE